MKKCKTCPFVNQTLNIGRIDWLYDVIKLFQSNSLSHSCHVTDVMADGYVGGQNRNCVGIKELNVNDKSGIHLHKDVFPNFQSFVKHHFKGIKKDMGFR